jgi:Carboxypeptidase regulatory-like domain/TonB dependent receptor-like, beta-barrel/TonB-dependent Receptor Plug Domain
MSAYLAHAPRWLRSAVALAVFLSLTASAAAQTETGRITGVVTDATGGILPGVTVNAKAVDTGATRTVVTDSSGQFVFANLPPAQYEITTELAGFNPANQKVTVSVGGAFNVPIKMDVAGTKENVNVVAEVPRINTTNGEVSTTITQTQIRELPTITRNVYDLVAVAGNVSGGKVADGEEWTSTTRGTGYAINGQRASSTNILLDGSANNNEFDTTVGQQVPLDSVQEFSVVTSNFSAQYGRAGGGIVNVLTKSGTNSFRGTGYEFYRSDALSTNSYDNKANEIEKGEFTRHQMGFSIGGPIRRDKAHFFSNLEYIRVRSADTVISWVPTQQFIDNSAAATKAFFAAYGGNVTPGSTVLTRGEVSSLINATGSGAFQSLPAGLPVFARVEKSLPLDAGGGDPQNDYQWVSRVDFTLSNNSQMYVRYAMQDQQAEPGTNSRSPYNGFDTGYVNKNHNILGSYTRVYGSSFTTQTKVTWNRLLGDQPLNGDYQPTLYMNSQTPVSLQGYRISFPGYLPWSPGNAIPFGGPQKLLQFYQDQTWIRGKHDFRFGGSYVHISDDRTFGAYANAVEFLNTNSAALPSLDNFVTGQLRRFQTAINPEGFPGGTYTTPVSLPSFTSFNRYNEYALYANDNWSVGNRLTVNLGIRYEYYGPQKKSDPKFDSNFYYGDPNVSVNSSTPAEIVRAIATGAAMPSNESPIGQLWNSDKNNWAPRLGFAWDINGDGRTSVRGGYGMSYERNFGNVTYNVLFNPPKYLVASIDAGVDVTSMPIFVDNAGPFGGVAGVTKTIPGGSLRHIDQNIETAYAHFYGLSFQRQIGQAMTGSVEYTGSSGRKLYDLADPNKAGAAIVYTGTGTATSRPNPLYGAFNTRGNRGTSQYHGVTFGLDVRQLAASGLQLSAKYTLSNAKDNLSSTFSESNNDFNLGYLDAFDPMLDYGYADFDVRHRLALSGVWVMPFARGATGVTKALASDWQLNWIFTARTGYPFTLFDCTNARAGCMRAENPDGIDLKATDGESTGNPNEFSLFDLTPLLPHAGGYVNALTGNSDFGPYPADMTERNSVRGPGYWNVDFGLSKRVRFGTRAVQFRIEAYDLFNHANMFPKTDTADLSSVTEITGTRSGNRRVQLGAKFEF